MKILLSGARGNMGKEVINSLDENQEIVCGFDRETKQTSFPIYNNIDEIKEKADVIIDFSNPKATLEIIKYASKTKTPIVIATTGFNEEENKIIEDYSKEIPIFKSANMSLDINLMADIVSKVASVLTNTDIEIIETHHKRKVDSPSGTAILLADAINEVLEEKKTYNFDRMSKREKRKDSEIGFSSIRGGNIVGKHEVVFFGESESLTITHEAYSRKVFASGALKAAKYLIDKPNGLYNMKDIVKDWYNKYQFFSKVNFY